MKAFIFLFVIFTTLLPSAKASNIEALKLALDDEYKAKATYQQVLEDFGSIKPFANIIRSEQKHIEALIPFFQKYNITVPSNPYLGKIESFASVKEACEVGVQAEIDNVALYDKIFSLTNDADLIVVFERLQWASQERHLRAFKKCVNRR